MAAQAEAPLGQAVAKPGRSAPLALILVYVVSLGVGFVYSGYIAFLPAYLTERSPAEMAGVLAGGALTTVVLFFGIGGQWSGGRLAEGPYLRHGYALAFLCGALAVATMSFLRGWPLVALGGLFSLLLFSCQPMGNALLAAFTPISRRGLAFGVSFTLSFGVGSLANASMGYVADQAGLNWVFFALGMTALPGVVAGLALAAGAGVRASSDRGMMTSREVFRR
jgi:hypothetical protein